MIEIKKISFSKLYKLEVPALLGQIIETIEKYNPEALRLIDIYDLLLQQNENAEILTVPYGKHSLTKKLSDLHKKRVKYAALITMQMRALKKADFEDTQHWVEVAERAVKINLTYLGQKRQFEVRDKINNFFSCLEKEVEVEEALNALGLQPYLKELEKTNMEHDLLMTKKQKEIRSRPKGEESRMVERESQYTMRLFLDILESQQRAFKHLNYEPLANELNGIMTRFSKMIKSRAAVNKRRAKKAKATKEAALQAESLLQETKELVVVEVVAENAGEKAVDNTADKLDGMRIAKVNGKGGIAKKNKKRKKRVRS